MAITEERRQSVDFTIPYFNNPLSIVCRKEPGATASADSTSASSVAPETARYGITSIVAQDYLSEKYPHATLSLYPAAADAMLALRSGKLCVQTLLARGEEIFPLRFSVAVSELDGSCEAAISYGGPAFDPFAERSDELSVKLVLGLTKAHTWNGDDGNRITLVL